MTWTCAAIDHGITFYQDGKIRPCCLIDYTYSKPISELRNDPFSDLRTGVAPTVCDKCTTAESFGLQSYRQHHNRKKTSTVGIQFLDIRNSNLCNIKCRTCCEENSSQWAIENGATVPILSQNISGYMDVIVNQNVHDIYYTGGEPIINSEHWTLLEEYVKLGYSKNINLLYNSNLTVLRYKDKDIFDLWGQFKSVTVNVSIDAVGEKFEYIRSGASWQQVIDNLNRLRDNNINIIIACTVSLLNLWFIDELLDYFKGDSVNLSDLYYPEYYRLSAVSDELKEQALSCVDKIKFNQGKLDMIRSQIINNVDKHFFNEFVTEVKRIDNIRGERLQDLLPFKI